MSRGGMGPTKSKLVAILLISSAILVVSSATVEDLVVVQCKNQCKHDLYNKKECEDRCDEKMMMKEDEQDPFCNAFCKPFSEDGQGMHQRCMTVCPRTKSLSERQQVEDSKGVLETKCNRKCSSYTEPETHKRCISECLRSIISKRIDNEAICESSCSVVQETPLIIRCTRVCHERIPGAVST
ncbi:unnamed protein product [Arabis nemorensis]|uniref:Uncharacterized protein n=1 Tax=Arabis nemorensis TaxID=586526 RepID=A0A565BZ49_9BRAS|nr:unnamed protein product [Arabis nemorensis]